MRAIKGLRCPKARVRAISRINYLLNRPLRNANPYLLLIYCPPVVYVNIQTRVIPRGFVTHHSGRAKITDLRSMWPLFSRCKYVCMCKRGIQTIERISPANMWRGEWTYVCSVSEIRNVQWNSFAGIVSNRSVSPFTSFTKPCGSWFAERIRKYGRFTSNVRKRII